MISRLWRSATVIRFHGERTPILLRRTTLDTTDRAICGRLLSLTIRPRCARCQECSLGRALVYPRSRFAAEERGERAGRIAARRCADVQEFWVAEGRQLCRVWKCPS